MIKALVKTNMLWVLVSLMTGFSTVASADAFHGTPPLCSGGGPTLEEAWVYTGQNYSGICYSLKFDNASNSWTSWDASTGFPNDQMQSVWTGDKATLVLFWNSLGTSDNGVPLHFGPGQASGNLGGWNRKASAARLQLFPFGQCAGGTYLDPSVSATLNLYTDQNFSSANDCTKLVRRHAGKDYSSPVEMGFRNDSMTSFINNAAYYAFFNNNSCFIDLSGTCNLPYLMSEFSSSSNVGSDNNDSLSDISWQ